MKISHCHLLEIKGNWIEYKADSVISFGNIFTSVLEYNIIKINRTERIQSFKTKNKKAERKTTTKYSVPVIDVSTYHLKDIEYQQLKLDIDYSSRK